MSESQGQGALKPISLERLVREVTTLSAQRKGGDIDNLTYDQRFARMIGELRERRVDASRPEITATLARLRDEGTITADEHDRLIKQLGLA